MFNNYPYSDLHEINLDWILKRVTALENKTDGLEGQPDATTATNGQVPTADGNGKWSWQDPAAGGIIDSALSSSSTHPVQNKVIYNALSGKAGTNISRIDTTSTASPGNGGTFTAIDQVTTNSDGQVTAVNTKTVTMPSGGSSVTVDSALSSSSTNPVQNKVIYNALSDKADIDVFAPEYNTSTTYNTGNYCTRNGLLYRCTGNTSGTWNSSKWTSVDVGEELELKATDWTIARSDTTSTASPAAGGTFTAIDSVTTDLHGCVTAVNTKTVTLPSTSVTVDSVLSNSSTNPVQNKVIYTALSAKAGIYYQYDNIYYNNETGELIFENHNGTQVIAVDLISYLADRDVATTSADGLMSASDKTKLEAVYADYTAMLNLI